MSFSSRHSLNRDLSEVARHVPGVCLLYKTPYTDVITLNISLNDNAEGETANRFPEGLTRPWRESLIKREESDKMPRTMIRRKENAVDKAIVDRLEEVANKKGVGMAQIAIAWSIKRCGVIPIVGLGSKERIDQAVEAVKIDLSDEDAKYLEEPYMPKQIQGYQISV